MFVAWDCLQFVILVFPDHTHLLFIGYFYCVLTFQLYQNPLLEKNIVEIVTRPRLVSYSNCQKFESPLASFLYDLHLYIHVCDFIKIWHSVN